MPRLRAIMGRKVVDNRPFIGADRNGRLRVAAVEAIDPLMNDRHHVRLVCSSVNRFRFMVLYLQIWRTSEVSLVQF
jgi:hypothetical protein